MMCRRRFQGELTDMRSKVVTNSHLAKVAAAKKLHRSLRFFSPPLMASIKEYVAGSGGYSVSAGTTTMLCWLDMQYMCVHQPHEC